MAFVHGTNGRILGDDLVLSGYLRSFEVGKEREMADVTVLTDNGHRFIPGLNNGTLSFEGLFDNTYAAGSIDDEMFTDNAGTVAVVTAAPNGFAVGNRVESLEVRQTNYAISSPVGDAVSLSASWTSEGAVDTGVSLRDLASASATANGTAVDNTAATTNGAVGALHVTANTRNGTTTVKLQHSVDNSVWVDLATFTVVGIGATTAERVSATGTVNRYMRAVWTLAGATGSITFAVAGCRR